jgi:tetratricopeptide (TPR) repeat protein
MAACQQDGESAIKRYEEALEIYRQMGDQIYVYVVLNCLGGSYAIVGRDSDAEAVYIEALQIARERGKRWSSIVCGYSNLAEIALAKDELPKARTLLESGMSAMHANMDGHSEVCGILFANFSLLNFRDKRYAESLEQAKAALRLFREAGLVVDVPLGVLCLGLAYFGLGDNRRATQLMGAFEKMIENQGLVPLSFFTSAQKEVCESLRRNLGTADFRAEIQKGREMSAAMVVDAAVLESGVGPVGTKASLI